MAEKDDKKEKKDQLSVVEERMEKISKGDFFQSLTRNNSAIKKDRAEEIIEAAEVEYRRKIEDMQRGINKLVRESKNSLDLSPDSATSLKLAKNFNEQDFVDEDAQREFDIYNQEKQLELIKARYTKLFGLEIQ